MLLGLLEVVPLARAGGEGIEGDDAQVAGLRQPVEISRLGDGGGSVDDDFEAAITETDATGSTSGKECGLVSNLDSNFMKWILAGIK